MMEPRLNILKLLSEYEGMPLSSKDMARILYMNGINVAERTVRYHLKLLEESGMIEHSGKSSRHITIRGRDAVEKAFGSEIAFVRNRFYNMACLTGYDGAASRGTVVLSTVTLPADQLTRALEELRFICETPFMMGNRVMVATEGQHLGGEEVPQGRAALGLLNSATSLGIMVRSGIPALPSYIGLVEYEKGRAERFSSIIGLQSVTEDVLSLYLLSGVTDVYSALNGDRGKLVSLFVEMPSACHESVRELAAMHELVNIMEVGMPGSRLLEVTVEPAKVGAVINDGTNAIALLKEQGVELDGSMHLMTYEYAEMQTLDEALGRYSRRRFIRNA